MTFNELLSVLSVLTIFVVLCFVWFSCATKAFSKRLKEVPLCEDEVRASEVKLIVRTFPSFSYVQYKDGFYEAVEQMGGRYKLGHKFNSMEEMSNLIDKAYPEYSDWLFDRNNAHKHGLVIDNRVKCGHGPQG